MARYSALPTACRKADPDGLSFASNSRSCVHALGTAASEENPSQLANARPLIGLAIRKHAREVKTAVRFVRE